MDSFNTALEQFDKTLAKIEANHKASVEESFSATHKIHADLNTRILDLGKRQNSFEASWTTMEQQILMMKDITDSMVDKHKVVLGNLEDFTQEIKKL